MRCECQYSKQVQVLNKCSISTDTGWPMVRRRGKEECRGCVVSMFMGRHQCERKWGHNGKEVLCEDDS